MKPSQIDYKLQRHLSAIKSSKIEMNWNKNPIRMDKFLSFLTVEVKRSTKHMGYENGWTQLDGDNRLVISGGIVNGVEYLNRLEYKTNLANGYNDFVNPFYLFDIITDEGKQFFLDYYKAEIDDELLHAKHIIAKANETLAFWESFGKNEAIALAEADEKEGV